MYVQLYIEREGNIEGGCLIGEFDAAHLDHCFIVGPCLLCQATILTYVYMNIGSCATGIGL